MRALNIHSSILKYKNSVLRAQLKLKSRIFRSDPPNFVRHNVWLTKFGGSERNIPLLSFNSALSTEFLYFKIMIPEKENNIFDSVQSSVR